MMEMNRLGINLYRVRCGFFILIVVLIRSPYARCVEGDDYSETGNPALLPLVTEIIYSRLMNITAALTPEVSSSLAFCVKDVCEMLPLLFSSLLHKH